MIKIRKQNKSGQVWIETVLYTLIGLVLIGLALGFIMPKINEARDKALVEQAINSLAELDSKITEVSGIFPKFFSDFIKDFVRKN